MTRADCRTNPAEHPGLTPHAVLEILHDIPDPEMPISIVDLGIVHALRVEGGSVAVDITPTFIGCPALDIIRRDVDRRLRAAGAVHVDVRFVNDPPWSVDRISEAGRESLRRHGVTVPGVSAERLPAGDRLVPLTRSPNAASAAGTDDVVCPYCSAAPARLESAFGPTRCRMIYYCESCKNSFEHLRRV